MIQLSDEICPKCGERLIRDANGIYHCEYCEQKMSFDVENAAKKANEIAGKLILEAKEQEEIDRKEAELTAQRAQEIQQQIEQESKSRMRVLEWIAGVVAVIGFVLVVFHKVFLIPRLNGIGLLLLGLSGMFSGFTLIITKQKTTRIGAVIILGIVIIAIVTAFIIGA